MTLQLASNNSIRDNPDTVSTTPIEPTSEADAAAINGPRIRFRGEMMSVMPIDISVIGSNNNPASRAGTLRAACNHCAKP